MWMVEWPVWMTVQSGFLASTVAVFVFPFASSYSTISSSVSCFLLCTLAVEDAMGIFLLPILVLLLTLPEKFAFIHLRLCATFALSFKQGFLTKRF